MKKVIVPVIAILLILSVCAAPSAPPAETPETIEPPSVTETNEPSPTDEGAWMDVYQDILLDSGNDTTRLITLADVTHDGVPELFFADLGTVNIWITRGYSYADGKITDVVLPDDWMPPALELHRDAASGEKAWIASQTARNGANEYIHTWYICDFSDLSAVKLTFIFGWIERTTDGNTWEYFLYGGDGSGRYEDAVKTSLEDVLARQEQVFADYALLKTNSPYAALTDFIIGYDGTTSVLTPESLDCSQLMAYFTDWQVGSDSPENRAPYSTPQSTPETANKPWKEAYISVLHSAIPYYSTDLKDNIDISRMVETVTSDNSFTASVDVFTVIDLDSDGTLEVVLSILLNENNHVGYEILHYQDGAVYGYTIWTRVMVDLKADATFTQAGGAADFGFGTMRFSEETWAVDRFAECASYWDWDADVQIVEYHVNNESTTEAEFHAIKAQQDAKPDAVWYEFTDANIEAVLN